MAVTPISLSILWKAPARRQPLRCLRPITAEPHAGRRGSSTRCFYHPGVEAVGVCNYRAKGLCRTCAHDLGHGLACLGKHEDQVMRLARPDTQTARATGLVNAMMYLVLGISLTALGLSLGLRDGFGPFPSIFTAMGLVFSVPGTIQLVGLLRSPRRS